MTYYFKLSFTAKIYFKIIIKYFNTLKNKKNLKKRKDTVKPHI